MTGPADTAGGVLYVVATPIGNLGDVTLRALEILAAVPLIAAEDTRITARLLGRYEITTAMTSFHARSSPGRLASLLAHLRGGADLALVTDAGTPLVSDPGLDLTRAWLAEGGRVVPIPGASAVLAAVVASGLVEARWIFEGFLPRTGRERRERIAAILADPRASIVYEAPGRLAATLRDLAAAGGADRPGAVCRELTKLHETVDRGSLGSLAAAAADGRIQARGEFVLVVGADRGAGRRVGGAGGAGAAGRSASGGASDASVDAARAEVEALVASGMARGEAARTVAMSSGLPRRLLYGATPVRDVPADPSPNG